MSIRNVTGFQGSSQVSPHPRSQKVVEPSIPEATEEVKDAEFPSSVWNFSKQVGKWKKSLTKSIQFEEMVQEPQYKEFLRGQELELKAKLPLTVITTMEREVLHILEVTIKDYQRYLGTQHNMTQQMKHRIHDLRLMIERKGILDEKSQGRFSDFVENVQQFLGTSI